MSADPPEITTNEEWRDLMVAARRERKWTQEELATRVHRHSKLTATQAAISQIESGVSSSSKLVRPICEVLSIPEPMHFDDEDMKQWWLTGHLMRAKNMKLFQLQLEVAKELAKSNPETESTTATEPAEPKPSRK